MCFYIYHQMSKFLNFLKIWYTFQPTNTTSTFVSYLMQTRTGIKCTFCERHSIYVTEISLVGRLKVPAVPICLNYNRLSLEKLKGAVSETIYICNEYSSCSLNIILDFFLCIKPRAFFLSSHSTQLHHRKDKITAGTYVLYML